ncbi:MAG: FAD-dependent oxidoreductase [Comamonadaceae bacterium]|nr:FAD-dependent oxidoreductase [Comamonadaceae bacterium]
MKRRQFLATGSLALAGCRSASREIDGGFTGIGFERGHRLRPASSGAPGTGQVPPGEGRPTGSPGATRRVHTLIAGGGVAGLAAARALRQRGIDDFVVLELEDSAGGNSRGGQVNGIACPLGAHYLPVPGDEAHEVQDLLEELGLRQRLAGRWQYDERHLCHSPQERLFFNGEWQEGLLPVQGVGAATLDQYRRFAERVRAAQQATPFAMPAFRAPASAAHLALDAVPFQAWLDREGLSDPQLRWYLDYSCRDDYGAGIASVSAWAGIHYFASRHGFHAPGDDAGEREGVLTWPEGNAWLTRRLAAPLVEGAGGRLRTGRVVQRIEAGRQGVTVDAWDAATDTVERWQAINCIVALPVFVAARVVVNAPDFLREAAARTRYSPWLVANLHIERALHDRPGAPPSWDNVLYGSAGLGYVDAMHQNLQRVPDATVLTYYTALGDAPDARRQLLERPWSHWRDAIVAELSVPHPDLREKLRRMDITRYGHAMAVPVPGMLAKSPLWNKNGTIPASNGRDVLSNYNQMTPADGRLRFAHSDWSGYSVFEEAFTRGHAAGWTVPT